MCLQQGLDATQPDAWTTTADVPQDRVPATDALQMSFGGVDLRFLIEATGTLLQDQVAAVFATGLDLLTAFCDGICRQRDHPDLAENVFPILVASVLTPLLAKMQDSSARVRRKATNAIMYVATFGEAADESGAGASFLVLEVAKAEEGAKKTAVLPRIEILRQLLTRPAVATGLLPEARAMAVEFLARLLDHRQQEVRQASLKGLVQAAGQGWAEVPALVARLDPKSQQRRALRKAGLEATRPTGTNESGVPATPGRSERGDSRVVFASPMQEEVGSVVSGTSCVPAKSRLGTGPSAPSVLLSRAGEGEAPELPFAEPIAEDARDFVQPLVDAFGDSWARCWYSPQWQLRVAALEHLLSKIDGSFNDLPPEDVFDAMMRVLNEGLGDQVVKVYFAAGVLLPQVLVKFTPVLDGQLIRAHVAPLLLHLMSRMGDQKEAVRSKTTQTLFAVLATGASRPTMVAQLVLDSLMGKGETITGKGASSVHGWMCRLSVLRDLVRDYDVCTDLDRPSHWLGALIPGVNHGAVPVRNAAIQLFVQVYKRCTSVVPAEVGDETEKEKGQVDLNALPTQVQQKMKRVLFEDADKENQLPEEKVKEKKEKEAFGERKDAFRLARCLPLFARVEAAELDVLVAAASAPPPKVCAALQQLGKALEWGSMKARKEKETALPTDLEVFEGLCEVLKHAFQVDDQSVFQASAQLCCAMLRHSDVSSLDVHVSVGKVFPSLLAQTNSSNHKIAMAADKTVIFLAKHPRVGNEAVARQVLAAISRTEQPQRLLGLLLRLVGEFGAYLCFQQQLVTLMFSTVAPLLLRTGDAAASQATRSLVAELVQRCKQLQPRIAANCLRDLDGPSRQALSALDAKKGGELLLLQESEVTSDTSSPAKPKRASRYRNASGKGTSSRDFCETPDMADRSNASAGSSFGETR